MKATFISRENNDVKFTMEFTAEEFENAQDVKSLSGSEGSVPDRWLPQGQGTEKHHRKALRRRRFLLKKQSTSCSRESYGEALKELDLEVVDAPAAEFSRIAKGVGFTITITVPCFPIIAVKDYQGVEIEKVSAGSQG